MADKSQILNLIQTGYQELMYFASLVGPEERAASGEPDRWGGKDILAHIAEWQMQTATELSGGRRMDPKLFEIEDVNNSNNIIFERYRAAPWDDVMAMLETAHQKLVEQVTAVTEEDLNRPGRYDWLEGRPLWRRIASDVYLHPMAHLNPEFVRRGEREHALQSQEEQVRATLALDPSDEWQGTGLYNMACAWALLGEKEKALELLEKGLRLAPRLAGWSREDSDLELLHGTPEFEAVLQRISAS